MPELPPVNVALLAAALERFLAEELRACGLAGYVVGLSGGIDSAVAAALAVRALGREKVRGLAIPGPSSNPESLTHGHLVAEAFGIGLEVVPLGESATSLARLLDAENDRVRFGNILARMRMITLFDRARRVPSLVLGTSNKSEILLGYSTMFGDSAASVQPLGDVWKTHVFALGRHLGVPDAVVAKPPSADLWPGQTDSAEMGFDYLEADPVLYWHHERGLGAEALCAAGFAPSLVDSVVRTYRGNRFKWRPTVVARVSASCVNVDRILPRNPGR